MFRSIAAGVGACLRFAIVALAAMPAVAACASTNLGAAREYHTATLLPSGRVLVAGGGTQGGGFTWSSAELYDPAAGTWSPAAGMVNARAAHTATLLQSGKVLVAGGGNYAQTTSFSSAEIYDPALNGWHVVANLIDARFAHTATLLPSGKVIVIGGNKTGSAIASVEAFDPVTEKWTALAPMSTPRYLHTTTLLPSGKLLVIGGRNASGALSSGEIYDPATNLWAPAAALATARAYHTATLLKSGKILVVDGYGNAGTLTSIELYDPAGDSWTSAGTIDARYSHTATLLPSGQVMIAGGAYLGASSTQIYDPIGNSWSTGPGIGTSRQNHTATLLPTGRVMLAGGFTSSGTTANVTQVDPVALTCRAAASLGTPRQAHMTALLASGDVLAMGGFDGTAALASSERYDAANDVWLPAASLSTARQFATATILPSGEVFVAGGEDAAGNSTASAELYDPRSDSWRTLAPMSTSRTRHVSVLLPNGNVLVVGGYSSTTHLNLASAEIYDPTIDQWSSAGSMASARNGHQATLLDNGKVLVAGGAGFVVTEQYDPATNGWSSAGLMLADRVRSYFTLTLLPDGRALAAGGNTGSAQTTTVDAYDPVANTWAFYGFLSTALQSQSALMLPSGILFIAGGRSSSGYVASAGGTGTLSVARGTPSLVLLPSGQVLVVGGQTAAGASSAVDVCDPGRVPDPSRQPLLDTVSPFVPAGPFVSNVTLTATGSGFSPPVPADGSTTNASRSNVPVFEIQRVDNGQVRYLPQDESVALSDRAFESAPNAFGGFPDHPALFPSGPALVRVWVNGIPSAARMTKLAVTPSAPRTPSASGGELSATVDFVAPRYDGGAPITLYTAIADSGGATGTCTAPCSRVTVAGLHPGTYAFFVYATNADGDGPSATASNAVVVRAAATSVATSSDVAPSVAGQTVTFSATVTGHVPGGTVTFTDGADVLCANAALSGGVATCQSSMLTPGSHNISAAYGGDIDNLASTAPALTQHVLAISSVSLTTTPNPSRFAQTATFTANVSGSSVSGSVTFAEAATVLCQNVPIANGIASCDATSLAVGSHVVAASYSGDANNTASTSNAVTEVVERAYSATTLDATPNPSAFGQSVTFTATVAGQSPSGTVTFSDGATTLCDSVALNVGAASCSTSNLGVGPHAIVAAYSGDGDNAASASASVQQSVQPAPSSTSLSSTPNPSKYGQTIAFRADVAGQSPSGSVSFFEGTNLLCQPVPLAGGSASCSTSFLDSGAHTITAVYAGDGENDGSTSAPLQQQVDRSNSTTFLSSGCREHTLLVGEPYTFVAGPAVGNGSVKFSTLAGALLCDYLPLAEGQARCITNTLPLAAGDASDDVEVLASYSGDANHLPSDSQPLTVTVLALDELIYHSGFEPLDPDCPLD